MDEQTALLCEMRDLLRLIAEPALAKRDEAHRAALREIVGKGKAKAKALELMNGSRPQSSIQKESGIDKSDLSKLLKALRTKNLLTSDENPNLVVPLPPKYFENTDK
jgi:hypothetical protein